MNNERLVFKYKCPQCQMRYPEMTPSGKCAYHDVALIDIKQTLSSVELQWHKEAFDSFPSVLAHEYHRLYKLCCNDNVFGAMLQLKDVIEATIKLVVLSVSAWAKYKEINGREESYEKELANEKLSFGDWITIAGMMKSFYFPKKGKYNGPELPCALSALTDEMPGWARNDDYDFSEWRNKTIGHGALAMEDDPVFYQEVADNINRVSEFFMQHDIEFRSIYMKSVGLDLLGKDAARDLPIAEGECYVILDDECIPLDPYIIHRNAGIYFYDEYANRKQQRLINYPAAKVLFQDHKYFENLSNMLRMHGTTLEKTIDADVITRGEDDYLSMLGAEGKGKKPVDLINSIRELISSYDKGVFLLEMERGCGKSFLSQKLNCRYEGRWVLSEDVDVRTYHLSRTQYGGVQEFLEGVKFEWVHAHKNSAEAARVKFTLERDREDPSKNAGFMAEYLNNWQKYTLKDGSRGNKPKILLILDGMDEIRETDDEIWSFIPNSEELVNGVYILLTGRVHDKEELPEYYKKRIRELNLDADPIRVLADSDTNRKFLKDYIGTRNLGRMKEKEIDKIIELSHDRILELTMICSMLKSGVAINTADKENKDIISAFLETVEKRYGEPKASEFKMLLTILSEVAVYEPLSMREIADLMQMGGVHLELFGMLADLAPLITIDRSFVLSGTEYSDMNRYRLSQEDIINDVREYLSHDDKENIDNLLNFVRENIKNSDPVSKDGMMAILPHITEILARNRIDVFWNVTDIESLNRMLQGTINSPKPNDGLGDLRILNLAKQIINIGKTLDLLSKEETIDDIIDAYHVVLQVVDFDGEFIKNATELYHLASQIEYRDPVNEAYNLCRTYTEMAMAYNDQSNAGEAALKAESINDDQKDDRFFKAQADAYVAFLINDVNPDCDYYEEFPDRLAVAEKAVAIAERMNSSPEDVRYIECYLRYSMELDDNYEEEAAEANLKKCIRRLLCKENNVGLSAQERVLLFRSYMLLGDHYLAWSKEVLAVEAVSKALIWLKTIQNVSVFSLPSSTIMHFYQIMKIAMEACEDNEEANLSVAESIYFSALEFFESFVPDAQSKEREDIFRIKFGERLCDVLDMEQIIKVKKAMMNFSRMPVEYDEQDIEVEDDSMDDKEDLAMKRAEINRLVHSVDGLNNKKQKAEVYMSCVDRYIELHQYEEAEKVCAAALVLYQNIIDEHIQDREHLNAHIDYAMALYKAANLYSSYVDDREMKKLWVVFAEHSLEIHDKLNNCSIIKGDEIIAELCCHLGQYYDGIFQRDKTKALYTKALEIYKRLRIHPEKVGVLESWLQEQNRFSLRGKIHWRLDPSIPENESDDYRNMLKIAISDSMTFPEMFFSRKALLPVMNTDIEGEFFNALLERINGKEICFVFERGGGSFVSEKTISELFEDAKKRGLSDDAATSEVFAGSGMDYLINGYRWTQVFESLRLSGNLLEAIYNRDCEWVGEFFEKMMIWAAKKYPQSFNEK